MISLALLLSAPTATTQQAGTARPQAKPLPVGQRTLSISLTQPADNDFDAAFTLAQGAGMQATSPALAWDELETAPGVYQPAVDWLGIANLYYPAQGVALSLEVKPIDTNTLRLPADLGGLAFDDALAWQQYSSFFLQVAKHARSLRQGFVVGTKVTYAGLMGPDAALADTLVAGGDCVFVTYYPLNADFTVQGV